MTARSDRTFEGRTVLVTGGARGIGRSISRAFAARGAHVVINYFHSERAARDLLAELTEAGHSAETVRASVASPEQVAAMFRDVAERHQGLDVLVNNAGAGGLGPVDSVEDHYWERAWNTDLRGSLWCARHAAPLIEERGGGAIVNVSSLGGGALVVDGYSACGTAKAALEALTRYLAAEYAGRRIRVNTATGGAIEGSLLRSFPNAHALIDRVREATPLEHRLGEADELAEVVVFLASPAASWITGQNLTADGGLSLGTWMLSPPTPGPAPAPLPARATAPQPLPVAQTPASPRRLRPPLPGPDPHAHIAIVGMGVVTPGANTPDELWQALSGDRHMFGRPNRFDADAFHSTDPAAEDRSYTRESGFVTGFAPHPTLAAEIADGTLLSTESTTLWLRHSLYHALDTARRIPEDRCFAAFGLTPDGSQDLEEQLVLAGYRALADASGLPSAQAAQQRLAERYGRLGTPPSEFLPHRIARNVIDGILPSATEVLTVDTACSTSLYSMDLALKALREDTCDIAVCGGAFALTARDVAMFSKLSGLSKTGEVRSFDRTANGVLFSDGAGVLLLKRLDRARADHDRVLGVIDGLGLSCDGRGKAIYAPNQRGQVMALRRAYAERGVDPASVNWMIAHATGTQAGDSTEAASLNEVAGKGATAPLSSNKAIVGHTGWAAATVSVIQALVGLERGTVPAQRYLHDPIDALTSSRFVPPTATTPIPGSGPRRAAVNAFGFGGTNGHLIVSQEAADRPERRSAAIDTDDLVVVATSSDVPGGVAQPWLDGTGPAPDTTFGEDFPLPGFQDVPLPPPTLRNMDRCQTMALRAYSRLPASVKDACTSLNDTTGVIIGHMGPTRRAVHYALRCYLGDLEQALAGASELSPLVEHVTEQVRSLVPPTTEDSFPGIMPNLIAARLASLCDFHGLNLTVDTGPDAALDALRTAERHLRHGSLDVAVVAAVNGNTTAEYAHVLGDAHPAVGAEGAFVAVVMRAATARRLGLTALARIRTTWGPKVPTRQPEHLAPLSGTQRSYRGADALVGLMSLLHRPEDRGIRSTISCTAPWGTQLEVNTGDAGPPHNHSATVSRMVRDLTPTPRQVVRPAVPALPDGALVLTDDPTLLDALDKPPSLTVVSPSAPGESAPCDHESLAALLPERPVRHIRILTSLAAASTEPSDLRALERLRPLYDLAHLAAQRWQADARSTYAALCLDSVRAGVPHPGSGLFTGLIKSLAREEPDSLSFAVVTDVTSPTHGLQLVTEESAARHELAVAVHHGGTRYTYTMRRAEAVPLPPAWSKDDSVIVAAGGARGLSAELLTGLVATCRPTVYILGRTAPAITSDLPDRAAYLTQRRAQDPAATVPDLLADYEKATAAAETRKTLERLEARCGPGRVHHLQCDVTSSADVSEAIGSILTSHSGVDLLLNSAGIHHGATIRATSLTRAQKVRDTKLQGYLNLHQAFASNPPSQWINVGSLLGILGWPGEAAYCAANEFLDCAARWARLHGRSEATFALALWDESGFASEPVTRELLRSQGALTAVSNDEGVALFLADAASTATDPEIAYVGPAELALLRPDRVTCLLTPQDGDSPGGWAFHTEPDGRERYLAHHLLNGRPTLPAALIAELAAEAAERTSPGTHTLSLAGLHFLAPAYVGDPTSDYRLETCSGTDGTLAVRLLADVTTPDGRVLRPNRQYASLNVVLSTTLAPPHRVPTTPTADTPRTPPWYQPGHRLQLSGPFASLTEVTTGPKAAAARFGPDLKNLPATRMPVLLIDALLQLLFLLRETKPTQPPQHRIDAALTGLDRIDVYTPLNDADLVNRYGSTVALASNGSSAWATTPEGHALLRVSGLHTHRPAPADPPGSTRP